MLDQATIERHNDEVRTLWQAFRAGRPGRVPVLWHMGSRVWMGNPARSGETATFQDYFSDPQVILRVELAFNHWRRFHVLEDAEKGLPAAWDITIDAENVVGASMLGCPVVWRGHEVPAVEPALAERRELLYELGQPALDAGLGALNGDVQELWQKLKQAGYEYQGRPLGTLGFARIEGPFSIAAMLRGLTGLMLDVAADPEYVCDLLDYATTFKIRYESAMYGAPGFPPVPHSYNFGDDPIESISNASYRALVQPRHRRLLAALAPHGRWGIHLCGQATHQLATLREMGCGAWDAGFPVDVGQARHLLGEDAIIWGNIHPYVLEQGPLPAITAEVQRVLASGAAQGGRLILGDGNNISQFTPAEHVNHAYAVAHRLGALSPEQVSGKPVPCTAWLPL